MIDFQPVTPDKKESYTRLLMDGRERGCEYSFANLCLWGRQKGAIVDGNLVLFSQYNRRSVYPFPVGNGDKAKVIAAIMEDAQQRGIPCRLTGLREEDIALLENLFPGKFRFHCDRDSYDYVYSIADLAQLKGRRYQKKRNHCNRFRDSFPYSEAQPIGPENIGAVEQLIDTWYDVRLREDPQGDYHMEQAALKKALQNYKALGMEGLVLMDGQTALAMTFGSPISPDTFDVHFEKALPEAEGAYAAINFEFARYLQNKYPQLLYLNREDDLGQEGLRKAKLSYYPHHMVEKCWACLLEDGYAY